MRLNCAGARVYHVPAELPVLHGRWKRAVEGVKGEAKLSGNSAAAGTAADLRRFSRQKWESNFREAFGMDGGSARQIRPSLQQRMAGAMENLPQACMQETRAWYGFELLGWALVLFQGSLAYCIMVNPIQTPVKIS